MKKLLFAFTLTATAMLFLASVGSALAAPEFRVRDESWSRVEDGKYSEPPTPNGAQDTGRGWIFWLFADPGQSDEAAGAERGMYFFELSKDKYTFMPYVGEPVFLNAVHFSPDGNRFIIESVPVDGDSVNLEAYDLDTFDRLFATGDAALSPFWLDSDRFVYSGFEPDTSRGRGEDELDRWVSLILHAVSSGETETLKKATDTRNYLLMAADDVQILVSEEFVNSPADWTDPEKIFNNTLNLEAPPAK